MERPIAFFSRTMNPAQRHYCATRRETLAVVSALQHFRHYLLGNKVILRTDHHSLKWLKSFKNPQGIFARWIESMAEFDYEIQYRPGRLHGNCDGLSRCKCKLCVETNPETNWTDELERADELAEPFSAFLVGVLPEISEAEMIDRQAEDPDLRPVIEWLEAGEVPSPELLKQQSLETRNLWRQVPAVNLFNGQLGRKMFDEEEVQLVVPHCLRKPLFKMAHSGPLAAHLGAQRMYQQLRTAYYWPRMRRDIFQWCRQCAACAQSRGPPTKHQGRLQKVITGAPLDIVAVDILSGLPTTAEGKKCILVSTDYFTKFSCAFALPDAEASTCMRALYDGFFAQFGLPKQLHSDQGKNFESKLFHELCEIAGIQKSRTTPFHAMCDGQTERMNRTLLQMLRKTADENPATWPQRLPTVMSAYRMTVHRTTGMTPNYAMFGRETMLPATLIARPPQEPSRTTVPFVKDLRDALRDAHTRVREATKAAAKFERRTFDQKSRQTKFVEGQLVWLFWPKPPVRQKFRKLAKLWTGPWRIDHFKSPLVVELKHTESRRRQTVHVDRLLPCETEPTDSVTIPPTESQPIDDSVTDPTPTVEPNVEETGDNQDWDSQNLGDSLPSTTRPVRTRRRPAALEPYILD